MGVLFSPRTVGNMHWHLLISNAGINRPNNVLIKMMEETLQGPIFDEGDGSIQVRLFID